MCCYHRIPKCHVLVELKLTAFSHENIGQLNTDVNWYGKHMAGMDNRRFVSRYPLELPKKEDMQRFLKAQISALDAPVARSG